MHTIFVYKSLDIFNLLSFNDMRNFLFTNLLSIKLRQHVSNINVMRKLQ